MSAAPDSAGSFCRARGCHAADSSERPYRIAYSSPSLSALMAVVSAGLAITAQLESIITPDLEILGNRHGLPELPATSIVLVRNPAQQSAVTETLAGQIVGGFRL